MALSDKELAELRKTFESCDADHDGFIFARSSTPC